MQRSLDVWGKRWWVPTKIMLFRNHLRVEWFTICDTCHHNNRWIQKTTENILFYTSLCWFYITCLFYSNLFLWFLLYLCSVFRTLKLPCSFETYCFIYLVLLLLFLYVLVSFFGFELYRSLWAVGGFASN